MQSTACNTAEHMTPFAHNLIFKAIATDDPTPRSSSLYGNLDDDSMYDDGEMTSFYEEGWSKSTGGKPDDCEGRVYGVKPNSIVSLLALIGGLVSAVGMPVAGSIIDSTNKRHSFGTWMAIIFVVSNFAMIFITPQTWLIMTLLQAVVATFSFFGLQLVIYAYLPELFKSEEECVEVTAKGRLYEQSGMLTLILLTTLVQIGMGLGAVVMARVAQVLAVVLGAPTLFLAFRLYKPRAANRERAPGRWLVTDGFLHLGAVFTELRRDFPMAARFLIGQTFAESATGSLTTVAVLILIKAGLSAWVGAYLAVVLLSMMFGPFLHQAIALRTSVKTSLLMSIAAFCVGTICFVFFAVNPIITWMFAPIIGIIYGWYYPGLNGLLAMLCPGGHEGEIAGLNTFTSTVISWVPPLIITIFNENGMLSVGLLSLPVFWVIGGSIMASIDTAKASADIEATLSKRQRFEVESGDPSAGLELSRMPAKAPGQGSSA